ncbi:Glycosyltransferase involved in cell wall bisynthesis [Formosa sp. Hel1_31_208]|uniref:glycosyltransferase family 4 protein n=1 Tax=Formosa sp. Hel1_31_208 TaxID=1798225 RepID=UPI00087B3B03|nr:glycosyltransferase family 4 protein [Formosa sp. Hel1_31_208]SDS68284.1 Glycosyltransferase involved in cell wall bisynthesis [Formosa sp. Hel1_31_208]
MKNVLYIGNQLHASKHNISYIDVLGPLLSKEGITMYYASSYNNKVLRLLDMIRKVVVLRAKVDAVLIDTYSTQNFYYALVISQLCRIFKLTFYPILHGGNLPKRLISSPKMSRLIFKNAKYNIAPSLYLKEAFERHGFSNLKYIPNSLQIAHYKVCDTTYDSPRLLWVRSFSKIYNPKLAVHVLDQLKSSYPKVQLCMVGPDSDGSLAEVKQMAADLKLEVKFTGKLTKEAWIALSADYNVFINTTNFDNMPLSVIEAMALGLPVVSTNVGGLPYLIDHETNGLLVEPNDVEAMAKAISELFVNHEKRLRIIKNAREKVEQFDWSLIKNQWLNILK